MIINIKDPEKPFAFIERIHLWSSEGERWPKVIERAASVCHTWKSSSAELRDISRTMWETNRRWRRLWLQFSVREVFNRRVTLDDRLISASPSITRAQVTPGVTWPTPRSHRVPRPAEEFNHHAAIMSPPPLRGDVTTSTHLAPLLSVPPVTCSHTNKENGDAAQQLRTTINSDLQGQSGWLIVDWISASLRLIWGWTVLFQLYSWVDFKSSWFSTLQKLTRWILSVSATAKARCFSSFQYFNCLLWFDTN